VLLTIQVLICDKIHLFGYINPHIYLLAVLLLPIEMPLTAQYIIGFFTGLVVDMFTLSLGVHASATLMVVFLRPYLVSALNGKKKADGIDRPVPGVKDFRWLLAYAFILTFLHHFMVVLLEAFTFRHFFLTLLSALLSALFTTMIILCVEYISYPINKR
jgi:glycerol uptake facilitator-like aquaporin